LRYYCPDIGLEVRISKELIEKLFKTGLTYYPTEYGGILVGRYSDDYKTCFIVDTILPIKSKSSRFLFERGNDGLGQKLTEYYNQEPSLIYLGEWHTHPDNTPTPSATDRRAMKQIAQDEKVKITSPVLIILGITKSRCDIGMYVQHQNKLHKYEYQQD